MNQPTITNGINGKKRASLALNNYYQLLGLVLFCLILGVGYFYLLNPKIEFIKKLNVDQYISLSQAQSNQDFHDSAQKLAVKMQTASQLFESKVKNLNQILPTSPELPELFALYEDLAKQANFELGSLSFSLRELGAENKDITFKSNNQEVILPALGSNLGLVDINLAVRGGGYQEVKNLLGLIEKNARLTDVLGLNITAGKSDESEYNFNLQTYYLIKENEKVGNKK